MKKTILLILFFACSLWSFGQNPQMKLYDLFGAKFKLDVYTTNLIQHFDSMNIKDVADYDRSFDEYSIKLIHSVHRNHRMKPLHTVRSLMYQMDSYMDKKGLSLDLKSDTIFVLYSSTSFLHIGPIHIKTKNFYATIYNRDSMNYGTTFDPNYSFRKDDNIAAILYTWDINSMIEKTMNYIPPITPFSPTYKLYRIIIKNQKVRKQELIVIPRNDTRLHN